METHKVCGPDDGSTKKGREASTKKNARRALKKKENPAPKREKKEIQYAVSPIQFGQQKPSQKPAGTGKNLKKDKKKLQTLQYSSRKHRRLQSKIERLQSALDKKMSDE